MPALGRGTLDRAGLFHADGEGLLHHHRDLAAGACGDDRGVAGGAREHDHALRLRLVEHPLERRIDRRRVEPEAADISRGDVAVGLGDADELDLLGVPVAGQNPAAWPCSRPAMPSLKGGAAAPPSPRRPQSQGTFCVSCSVLSWHLIVFHGIITIEPTVRRPSRSRCTCAASASG